MICEGCSVSRYIRQNNSREIFNLQKGKYNQVEPVTGIICLLLLKHIVNFGIENEVIIMAKIFISYSRQSEAVTQTLAKDMDDLGHSVWFDRELSGGQSWWDKIIENIRECETFVMVLDPRALSSIACKREYSYAHDLGKPILPVLVSSEVSVNLLPEALSKIQMVDYRNRDTEAAFKLARALTSIRSVTALPNPLPDPPEAPLSALGALAVQVDNPGTMNFEEQSSLLFKIKKNLLDDSNSDDACKLLARMRKRPDLLVSIADEIDDLLQKQRKAGDTDHAGLKKTGKKTAVEELEEMEPEFDEDADMHDHSAEGLTLQKIVVGSWNIQISQMFTGTITASFTFNPNGTFAGQLHSAMGNIPVQGQWSVNMQMLFLNGYQTLAFVNYPYSAEITFMIVLKNRLEGTSQAGETVLMTR